MFVPFGQLDIRLTLIDSAQTFLWQELGGAFGAIISGHVVLISPVDGGWDISCEDEPFLRQYFDLDRDYTALRRYCARWPVAQAALDMLPGLRVLRQSPWDALLMFLVSQNNNAGRIRSLVLRLCEAFGPSVETALGRVYGLPSAETLASVSEETLRWLRFGYRASYVSQCARAVSDGFPLADAVTLPYGEAKRLLMELPGVGGKVADCVLLFGCGHTEAFPVDVWVERLLGDWFGIRGRSREETAELARELFGGQGGIVQQYLFHCARMGLIEREEDVE